MKIKELILAVVIYFTFILLSKLGGLSVENFALWLACIACSKIFIEEDNKNK